MCRVRSGAWLAVKGMPCGVGIFTATAGCTWLQSVRRPLNINKTEGLLKVPEFPVHTFTPLTAMGVVCLVVCARRSRATDARCALRSGYAA